MMDIWAIEKKHQIDACSMRLELNKLAMTGPKRNRKTPWRIIPFFSYNAKKGANMRNEWIDADIT